MDISHIFSSSSISGKLSSMTGLNGEVRNKMVRDFDFK
jgi:hypothetical protein